MVRAYSDVPGGAPSNLDRVREIIAGADFKAFELKFQRHEEALGAFRKTLILDRLRCHNGSAVDAAASLRIPGPTFYRYWADAKRFP